MDLNDLRKIGRNIEVKRLVHPPTAVQMAVLFPFEVRKVRWKIVDSPNGRQPVQQKTLAKEDLFGLGEPIDPWQVRKEFLELRTEAGLLKFLNQYGKWDDSDVPETVEEFWHLQAAFAELQNYPPQVRRIAQELGWKRKFTCSLHWQSSSAKSQARQGRAQKAVALWRVDCRTIMDALIASIQIDLVRGVKDRECKRSDCRLRFVPKTSRQRYCTQYCSHLVSVRRNRRISNAKKWRIQGMSLTQIARRLATNRNTVKKWLQERHEGS
jgi:hypothetical protein